MSSEERAILANAIMQQFMNSKTNTPSGNEQKIIREIKKEQQPTNSEDLVLHIEQPEKKNKIEIALYDNTDGDTWTGFKINPEIINIIDKAMNAVAAIFNARVIFNADKIIVKIDDLDEMLDQIEIGSYNYRRH